MGAAVMKRALQLVLGISAFGMIFSGTLTYRELVTKAVAACPSPGPSGTIFGYPACVYGLLMYTVIATVAAVALWSERRLRMSLGAHSSLTPRSS